MKKQSFAPIVNKNSNVLILGTMPSDRSQETGQYYANPSNKFWLLVSEKADLSNQPYKAKYEYLLDHNIAIWDVLQEAERDGSSDGNIKNDKPNDFNLFFKQYPNIKHIFFNGTKAAMKFKRYFANLFISYDCMTLSSSSSAPGKNVKSLSEKQRQWFNALSF